MSESLEQWLRREYRHAAKAMLVSVSPVDIVKKRPGFGQIMRPIKGAIVASPILGAYDPDPDYFFHWYRDTAVVVDALRLLFEDGSLGDEAVKHLGDFVQFSLSLQRCDGRTQASALSRRANAIDGFQKFLRDDDDLAAAHGDAVAAETRVNPDGTLDVSKWPRPQHDGAPLTALALLRWLRAGNSLDAAVRAGISTLIRAHLAFSFSRWREPSYDIWEEEKGQHYYTLRVAAAALDEGADWLDGEGDSELANSYRAASTDILRLLDGFWLPDADHYRSRVLEAGARSTKELDIAVILSAIHVDANDGAHSIADPRMQATLARLEALFDASYAINRDRDDSCAPAMGRYAGDVYYSGGAYYFSTLGAAEFCFRRAAVADDRKRWFARGDAWLETVRRYTPASGDLSEQFDQNSGAQTSAKHLAWSYAAFISCLTARRRAASV